MKTVLVAGPSWPGTLHTPYKVVVVSSRIEPMEVIPQLCKTRSGCLLHISSAVNSWRDGWCRSFILSYTNEALGEADACVSLTIIEKLEKPPPLACLPPRYCGSAGRGSFSQGPGTVNKGRPAQDPGNTTRFYFLIASCNAVQ